MTLHPPKQPGPQAYDRIPWQPDRIFNLFGEPIPPTFDRDCRLARTAAACIFKAMGHNGRTA